MGVLSEYLKAAQSNGDTISGLKSYTSIDSRGDAREAVRAFRWAHAMYYDKLKSSSNPDGEVEMLLYNSGEIVEAYKAKYGELSNGIWFCICEALYWMVNYITTGEKFDVRLAYISTLEDMNPDLELKVHKGECWNCLITEDRDGVNEIAFGDRKMYVFNRSIDKYAIALESTKEGL